MILIRDNDTLDYKKLYIPSGLCAAVIYPHVEVLTKDSRGILRPEVSFKEVIKQQGNLGAFVAAMYTSDFDLIGRCLEDILVEPQRAHLIPKFYDMKSKALELGALGFSISGAGPSMFALCANSGIAENILESARAIYKEAKIEINTYFSKINHEGAILF
jgi:homoserine kinase